MATINDFDKLDIRVGKIMEVIDFPEARKPTYKLTIDFGKEHGIKHASAQICGNYHPEDLLHKNVMGVVNFPPRQIGPFVSEVLVLGVQDDKNATVLMVPDRDVSPGQKLF
ncbi:MAG: tRNA-binding protein [Bacteroidales bacterium]|nr:tRNA-binding protein [Bacteroidales bacterium]